MLSLAMVLLLGQSEGLPLWSPGKQVQALCRPWAIGVDPPLSERMVDEQFFTFQEAIPADIACPTNAPCLIARPEILRKFLRGGREYLGFELVLANPTARAIRLVFPEVLPIVRQTFDNQWRAVEAQPCWPWCGNANDAVDLKAGYCFRFAVPVYAGDLRTRQRFHGVLNSGLLMGDARVELVSNEFESSLSVGQLVPANQDCAPFAELLDTTLQPDSPVAPTVRNLPLSRSLVDFWSGSESR